MSELEFQLPTAIVFGVVLVIAALIWFAVQLFRGGVDVRRVAWLLVFRIPLLVVLMLLVARPVWTSPDQTETSRDQVAILIDRSESMSVREGEQTRYEQAVNFARDVVLPAVDQTQLKIRPILFSEDAREVSGEEIATASPDGAATNLGRAIVQAVLGSESPPLVAIALTDGIVTNPADQSRAVAALVTHGVPIVSVGFGSQAGGRVVMVDGVDAPSLVEPGQSFRVAARLRATGQELPPLTLLLMRNGQLVDRRTIQGFAGPRTWIESFDVAADVEGTNTYTVRLMQPADSSVALATAEGAAVVRVVSSSEIRVLYVQGGLTWDYKFVSLALSSDPTIRLSGLSRTASTSKFFENVQSDVDLVNGFPSNLEDLSEFRVVVLSNLRPGDLTPHQQQLLARFCGELGGGVLMIGGPQTFNASWRNSRLEELLPVRFAVLPATLQSERFNIRLTPAALAHPVFQLSEQSDAREAWRMLPTFSYPATVEGVKPGAEVWLKSDSGSVLMASQRYGNGLASVLCMQNMWRWRLARESNTEHFDRFWRQLLRFLAESGRELVTITPTDLSPSPGEEVGLLIESRELAGESQPERSRARLIVEDPEQQVVLDLPIELSAGGQASATFTADTSGLFTATLVGPGDRFLASREITVRDAEAELASTSRNMETLRQLAGISGGLALEAEAADDLPTRLDAFLDPEEQPQVEVNYALPAGVNGWMLALLLTCITGEWLCRKRWGTL
jgi:uncharacterized membrane protein